MARRSTKPGALLVALCLALVFSASAEAASTGAMAWGGNSSGQIGNGTTTLGAGVPTATPVSGLANAVQISSGGQTALALLADGSVVGWGDDFYGQVGDGGGSDKTLPVLASKLPRDVIAVEAGSSHSLALLANGTVLAWGEAGSGQLGVPSAGLEACGPAACRKAPAPVPGLSGVIAISASESSNVALLADGTVMAWGSDRYGQVGDGTGTASGCECVPTPVPVPGVRGAVSIESGAEGGAAVLADGSVKDWGTNIEGQIGNGTVSKSPPACVCLGPTAVPGLTGVKAMAGGGRHRLSLQADGSLRGWGANNVGQLGQGTTASPVPSPAVAAPGLSAVQAVSAGTFYALVLLPSGGVIAWGYNDRGQLGDGTITQRPSPQAVPGVAGASAVAGHGSTSYALIGPSQTLTVALAGARAGSVGTKGLLCPGACAARFPQGQTETLRAEPSMLETLRAEPGAGFAGWSGPCTGTGLCRVRLDADQTVTATFGPPAGTAITAALVKSKKKKATFSFTAPGAITGYQCKLIKPKAKKHGKGKASASKGAKKGKGKKKSKPPAFTACATPNAYKHLKPGAYSFEVRALDILGADAVPATKKFTIKKPKKHHKHHKKGKH